MRSTTSEQSLLFLGTSFKLSLILIFIASCSRWDWDWVGELKYLIYRPICQTLLFIVFMPPPRRAPEALCFRVVRPSVRPSVHPSVRPSVRTRILLTRNLKNPLVDFHHTWPRGAPWRVDELIRFWARSAQGQRSKVNELGLNMLFLPR